MEDSMSSRKRRFIPATTEQSNGQPDSVHDGIIHGSTLSLQPTVHSQDVVSQGAATCPAQVHVDFFSNETLPSMPTISTDAHDASPSHDRQVHDGSSHPIHLARHSSLDELAFTAPSSITLTTNHIRKPRGSFFYHISHDSSRPTPLRLKRKATNTMDSLTDHHRRSDDTAVAIINAKWLTSTMRPIQEPTNEAGVHENSPGGYTCPSSVATDGSNEAGAPPHTVKSEEAPGFHPIDVDQEMEAPSFQLLNFAAHVAAPVPLFDQAIPADRSGDVVEPTSMPGDSQGAPPSFSLLSSLRTDLPPSDYSLPRPAEFQEDRGVVWVDDGGPRRQLMHPTASLDSDHCSSTLHQDRRPSHSSQSSSTYSDLAMRQAGLDDSSDEEEIKPRKQLRGNRVSIQSAEWTCKWCTYANEGDGASNECDCCGQAKGSSEFNHFDDLDDDDDFEVYASDSTNNPPDVVDLTAASDGSRQPLYDNESDSIEEISDTE
ncbi:hypothetical protein DYB25_004492, partial [Aphanomyces astaci]